jgi:hypothetical protein
MLRGGRTARDYLLSVFVVPNHLMSIKFWFKPMHLNIKNDEVHRLATELARLPGENLTSAVTAALRERLARERRRRRTDDVAARTQHSTDAV